MRVLQEHFNELADFGYVDKGDHYAKAVNRCGVFTGGKVLVVRIDKEYGTIYAQTAHGVYESAPKIMPNVQDIKHLIYKLK